MKKIKDLLELNPFADLSMALNEYVPPPSAISETTPTTAAAETMDTMDTMDTVDTKEITATTEPQTTKELATLQESKEFPANGPKPTFFFPALTTSTASSLLLNNNSSSTSENTTKDSSGPGFLFSAPVGNSLFSFGSQVSTSNPSFFALPPPSTTPNNSTLNDNTVNAREEEEELPPQERNEALIRTGEGEEEEETLHEVRAKLFKLVKGSGEWVTFGVGLLKVNQNKEDKKARLIVRMEGSGKVLLNAPITTGALIKLDKKRVILPLWVDQAMLQVCIMVKTTEAAKQLSIILEQLASSPSSLDIANK